MFPIFSINSFLLANVPGEILNKFRSSLHFELQFHRDRLFLSELDKINTSRSLVSIQSA